VTLPGGITAIGVSAFSACSNLAGIQIPGGVTSIGDSAFNACTALANVTIPDGVTNIGDQAFNACSGLTNATIPAGVTRIGSGAFGSCTGLSVCAIPNSVTAIGDGAFYGCIGLANVAIPDSVTSLGSNSFAFCSALTNASIGKGLTNIGNYAFEICGRLSSITVDALNPAYSSVDGVLFDKLQTTLIQYPAGRSGAYAVPNGVASIGAYALASPVQRITSVTIPDTVTNIGEDAFASATNLASVTIGKGVTEVGDYAFSRCTNLTCVYFHGNAPKVGADAFSYDFVVYETTLQWFDPATLYYWPGSRGWGSNSFAGLPMAVDPHSQCVFMATNGAATITAYIGTGNALAMPALVDGLPLTGIGNSAFCNATNLSDITISDGITNIGASAFSNCVSLELVTIMGTISHIGDDAFYGCSNLKTISFLGPMGYGMQGPPPNLGTDVFYGDRKATVFVMNPQAGWEAYYGGLPTQYSFNPFWPQIFFAGVGTNGFGIDASPGGLNGLVVEACTNLAHPTWFPVLTNETGPQFTDPEWTNYPCRFFRLRGR
jgi:hypothetical protein